MKASVHRNQIKTSNFHSFFCLFYNLFAPAFLLFSALFSFCFTMKVVGVICLLLFAFQAQGLPSLEKIYSAWYCGDDSCLWARYFPSFFLPRIYSFIFFLSLSPSQSLILILKCPFWKHYLADKPRRWATNSEHCGIEIKILFSLSPFSL